LYVSVPEAGKYKVELIAANGQTVSSNAYSASQAGQVFQLNRGNYAPGLYRIAVSNIESGDISRVFSILFE
jgi:hypothetical protein